MGFWSDPKMRFGFDLSYQYFDLDVKIDKTDWGGRGQHALQGACAWHDFQLVTHVPDVARL